MTCGCYWGAHRSFFVFKGQNLPFGLPVEKPKYQKHLPKVQFDTLEEAAVFELLKSNPTITQIQLAEKTGKSVSTIKRIVASLQKKQYIRRVGGKRYGKWDVLV